MSRPVQSLIRSRVTRGSPPEVVARKNAAIDRNLDEYFFEDESLVGIVASRRSEREAASKHLALDRGEHPSSDDRRPATDVSSGTYRDETQALITQYRTINPPNRMTVLLQGAFLRLSLILLWIQTVDQIIAIEGLRPGQPPPPPGSPPAALRLGLDAYSPGTCAPHLPGVFGAIAPVVLVLSLGVAAAQDRKRSLILAVVLGGESDFAVRVLLSTVQIRVAAAGRRMISVIDGGVDRKARPPGKGGACAACGMTPIEYSTLAATKTARILPDDVIRASYPQCPLPDSARAVRGWGHCLAHMGTAVVVATGCECSSNEFKEEVVRVASGFAWDHVIAAARTGKKADSQALPDGGRVTTKRAKTTLSTRDGKRLFATSRKVFRRFLALAPKRWHSALRRVRQLFTSLSLSERECRDCIIAIHAAIERAGMTFLWTEGPHHSIHTVEFAFKHAGGLRGVLDERVESSNQTVDDLLLMERGSIPAVMMREGGRVQRLAVKYGLAKAPIPPPAPPSSQQQGHET